MENKNTGILAQCRKCKSMFELNGTNGVVKFNQKFMLENKVLFITYYDCPKCGCRHFAQVDDDNTLSILNDALRQANLVCVARLKGKKISQKQSDAFKKTREHLSLNRKHLIEEVTGKTIVDVETGVAEKDVRFSL